MKLSGSGNFTAPNIARRSRNQTKDSESENQPQRAQKAQKLGREGGFSNPPFFLECRVRCAHHRATGAHGAPYSFPFYIMKFGLRPTSERICGIIINTGLGVCVIFTMIRALVGSPVITIHNTSPYTLTKLKALDDGFSKSLPDSKSNERYHFIAIPDGESSIDLEFVANGIARLADGGGYFESGGGCCVTVTIGKDMSLKVKTRSPLCFTWRRIVYPSDRSLLWKIENVSGVFLKIASDDCGNS